MEETIIKLYKEQLADANHKLIVATANCLDAIKIAQQLKEQNTKLSNQVEEKLAIIAELEQRLAEDSCKEAVVAEIVE